MASQGHRVEAQTESENEPDRGSARPEPFTALSRRGFLSHSATLIAGSAAAVLAATTADAQTKMSKEQAGYQTFPKDGHECSNCKFFVSPNSCQVVEGIIIPSGWCKLWLSKSA
jgi:hypothetical protein